MEVCRICLAVDRKMFALDTKHKQLYENVTGLTVPPIDRLPKHVCWECRHFMSKYFNFKSKAVTSHYILMEILRTQNVTLNTLKKYQPKPTLTNTRILYLYLEGIDNYEFEDVIKIDDDNCIEYKNEADHIWEVDPNNAGYDNGHIYVQTEVDDKTMDYSNEVAELKTEETDKSISNIDITEDSVMEINNKNNNKIQIVEEIHKKVNNKNVNNIVIAKEIDNNIQIVDNHPEDNFINKEEDGSSESNKNNDNVSKHISNQSNEPVVTSKSKKKLEFDKTFITVTTLSKEEQIADMKKREESANYVKSPLKCSDCFKGFIDTDAFSRHMELHSESMGAFVCELCKLRYRRRSRLKAHTRAHWLRIRCKQCDFCTHSYYLAFNHQLLHGGKRHQCPHCAAGFAHISTYLSHVRTKHPSDVICQQCGCGFINFLGLRMHRRKVHRFDQKPIPEDGPHCERCDLRFVSQEAFDNHKLCSAKHADERVGRVVRPRRKRLPVVQGQRLCADGARTRRSIPNSNATGPYPCEQCDKVLPDPRAYFVHFRKEHKGHNRTAFFPRKFYQYVLCEICGQMCQSKSFLREHQQTHPESSLFNGERCGKQLSRPRRLRHRRRQCGDPVRFPCSVCGKVLSSKSNQKRHMDTHKGNIYICEICHKEFNDPGNKKNHIDFVHKKKARPKRNRGVRRRSERQPEPELHSPSRKAETEVQEDSTQEEQ